MMITKQIALALALTLGATIGAATAASAQSAYTTGTIASSERAALWQRTLCVRAGLWFGQCSGLWPGRQNALSARRRRSRALR
jgi:hypothetical protein